MQIEKFVQELDAEIEKLTRLKSLALEVNPTSPKVSRSPRGPYKKKKRVMSPEARAKISKAVKARWAGLKKKAA